MAKAMGDGKKRRHFITYKAVDSLSTTLRDKFLASKNRKKESCGEGCMRYFNFMRFCLSCSVSLFQVLAPWVLSTIELVSVLLIYFFGISFKINLGKESLLVSRINLGEESLLIHEAASNYHFSWQCSLEDILGLAIARSLILSCTYAWEVHNIQSSGSTAHRMYLFASYLLAALCFPYIIVKTIFYHYSQDAIPASAILIITGVFCWVHVFAARHTAAWARRRFQMGLSGSIPGWEDPEETYVLKRPDIDEMTKNSDPRSYLSSSASFGLLGDWSADVAAESLADVDSRFIEVNGIRVHYKEVWPSGLMSGSRCGGSPSPGSSASSDAGGGASMGAAASGSGGGGTWDSGTGIVLVHGFGGGVFAWRHIMEALSLQCQCRVVAFDRPAFGLTSRPILSHEQRHSSSNPYSMGAQAGLMMQLCSQLGLRKVLLLAHADACLLALRAASLSAEHAATAASCVGRAGCMGEDIDADGAALTCCGDPVPADHITLTVLKTAEDPGAEDPGSPRNGDRVSSEHRSPATPAVDPPSHSDAASGGAVAGSTGDAAGREPLASSGAIPVLATSNGRSGFEGPEALVAASCALGTMPSVSVEGSGSDLPFSPTAGSLTSPYGGIEAASESLAAISSSLSMGGPLSAQPGAWQRPRHRRCLSVPMPVEAGLTVPDPYPASLEPPFDRSALPSGSRPVLLGLVLLHPNLVGPMGPTLSRLLSRSTFGRSILRPLLRSEVGEVANRRAWHHAERLTPEVLELYKTPLRVEGWDTALMETARLDKDQTQGDLSAHLAAARLLPTLVVTATDDYIATMAKVDQLCATSLPEAQTAVLSDCGHLSHEEAPGLLLQELMPFCGQVLLPHQH